MSKIVFNKSKGFERASNFDYMDNGDNFHVYLYKNILPVEKLVFGGYKNNCYISIRMDLLGLDAPIYEEDYDLLNMYNGLNKDHFDMKNFTNICDTIITKYHLNKEVA